MKRKSIFLLAAAMVSACAAPACSGVKPAEGKGVIVICPRNASLLETLAAREIRRYVYLRTGQLLPVVQPRKALLESARAIVVAQKDRPIVTKLATDTGLESSLAGLGEQSYLLKTVERNGQKFVLVVGGDEVGALYAAYRFAFGSFSKRALGPGVDDRAGANREAPAPAVAEAGGVPSSFEKRSKIGVRFYLHGDVIPDRRIALELPELDEREKPLFELRGIQPFHDFPEGPDWWNLDDYRAIISQLPKLRMNFIALHTYPEGHPNAEPTVWIGLPEDVGPGGRVKSSYPASYQNTLRGNWGYAAKKTSNFGSFSKRACKLTLGKGPGRRAVPRRTGMPLEQRKQKPFLGVLLKQRRGSPRQRHRGVSRRVGSHESSFNKRSKSKFIFGASQLFERDAYGADVMLDSCPRPEKPVLALFLKERSRQPGKGRPGTGETRPEAPGAQPPGFNLLLKKEAKCNEVFRRTGAMLREAFRHAHMLGIKTCVGTETPLTVPKRVQQRLLLLFSKEGGARGEAAGPGAHAAPARRENRPAGGNALLEKEPKRLKAMGKDAADPAVIRELYEGIFLRAAGAYPLDYYWFWTPEGWTWQGVSNENVQRTLAFCFFFQKKSERSATGRRRAPNIPLAVSVKRGCAGGNALLEKEPKRLAIAAAEKVKAPFQLATCGWVLGPQGDRAMFDRVLPKEMSVSCINRQVGKEPRETRGFAKVKGRGKWAIPWLEDDPALTSPQLWAGRMRRDAADALRYGCTGLMGIHWRTRVLGPNVLALAWAAWDQAKWSKPEHEFSGPVGGQAAAFPNNAIADTEDVPLYQTVRYDVSAYRFDVPNGKYTVTLKFCEPHYKAKGKRVFDVKLEGKKVFGSFSKRAFRGGGAYRAGARPHVAGSAPPEAAPLQSSFEKRSKIENLDIFARVGQNKALDFTFEDVEVAPRNAGLDVDFVQRVEYPILLLFSKEEASKVRARGPHSMGGRPRLKRPCGTGNALLEKERKAISIEGAGFTKKINCGGPAYKEYAADSPPPPRDLPTTDFASFFKRRGSQRPRGHPRGPIFPWRGPSRPAGPPGTLF